MRRNTPGLPWEHQFSRQRQARNIAPNIGPQVELPGKNIKGIVSRLRGHLHHDVAIEDVGREKHLPSGESPLTDGAGSILISASALSVLKSRASEYCNITLFQLHALSGKKSFASGQRTLSACSLFHLNSHIQTIYCNTS